MQWKLADAKNRFSELVNRAASDGPQFIRRRKDTFVLVSEREYRKLTGDRPSLKKLILEGPDLEGVDLSRDPSPMRDFEL